MLFTTITFWLIFTLFLLFFVAMRKISRVGMIIYVTAFSLGIYYYCNGLMMLLLPCVALLTWGLTAKMSQCEGRHRKTFLWATILLDLLPLVTLKMSAPLLALWSAALESNFSLPTIMVPIGISFFSLQAISYAVDTYRGDFQERVNLLEFLFYLSFFPLIFAGPITRAEVFFSHFGKKQMLGHDKLRRIPRRLLYTGLWLIMLGLVKKLVVADYIAQYNNWIFADPMAYSGLEVAMGVVGYTAQIYCDFSGYSDLSIGMAALMGVALPHNFNLPYQSLNPTEFWHRWHISLSTWFRDYLYIPLGGNRKGRLRTYLHLLITMLAAGLWHGVTAMFIFWGLLHGTVLIVHKACQNWLSRIPTNWITRPISWILAMLFIMASWVVFRAPTWDICQQVFLQIFTHFDWAYLLPFLTARPLWTLLMVGSFLFHATRQDEHQRIIKWYVSSPWLFKVILFLLVVQVCIQMHTSNVQPFLYYQF